MVFSAHTKLLLTGEYLILHGAEAIVLPLIFRQQMTVNDTSSGLLHWESYENEKLWYSATFDSALHSATALEDEKSLFLQKLLQAVITIKPEAKKLFQGKIIRIDADFKMKWGLGSSSTLISLLAQYAGIDAFVLHQRISKGSGYDVVAATQDNSFLFTRSAHTYSIREITLEYPFQNHLYFVYTGRKQKTDESLKNFSGIDKTELLPSIEKISLLTRKYISVKSLSGFEDLISQHEDIIAQATRQPKFARNLFPDLPGAAKSLGAWGGDFVLITWRDPESALKKYLQEKGLHTFFPWRKIVLNKAAATVEV